MFALGVITMQAFNSSMYFCRYIRKRMVYSEVTIYGSRISKMVDGLIDDR